MADLLNLDHKKVTLGLSIAIVCTVMPSTASSQSQKSWNHPEAIAIIQKGQELRSHTSIDSLFRDYQAEATGHVYFFADGITSDDRILIKADQIALDVFWSAPNKTKQIIVGQRDRKMLPTNIQYHLDHLTIIQDDFSDSFYLGGGDEIRGMEHPLSLNSTSLYDFQIADSISITLPGLENIKVYELNVRPKNSDIPGVAGSIYLQDLTGGVVRMSLTFTPSSYIDPNLDYIRIITDNSIWNGRHWLPYDQKIEIRRESTLLDLPIGTTIQTHFQIRNYRFNQNLSSALFSGSPVVPLPPFQSNQHIFDTGLLEDLPDVNYASFVDMDQIGKLASEFSGAHSLARWKKSRVFVPALSSIYRRNRAEGSFFGIGNSLQIKPYWKLQSHVGYAEGAKSLALSSKVSKEQTGGYLSFQVFRNNLNDIGATLPGSSGAMNSLASTLIQQDYLDPYFSSGIKTEKSWSIGSNNSIRISGAWEQHRSANNVMKDYPSGSGLARKIRTIDDGDHRYLEFAYSNMTKGFGLQTQFTNRTGKIDEEFYTNFYADIQAQKHLTEMETDLKAWLRTGIYKGANSSQFQYLLGGRHTLPGYSYRSFSGYGFALLTGEVSRPIWSPWMTLRIFGSTGTTGTGRTNSSNATATNGFKTSIGMGLGFGWDLLRFNIGRGISEGGNWELTVSADHRFWDWL